MNKNQAVFHDVAYYIKVKPYVQVNRKNRAAAVAMELIDFSVFHSQDSLANAEVDLSDNAKASRKIVVRMVDFLNNETMTIAEVRF